jgi:hypothetical protein
MAKGAKALAAARSRPNNLKFSELKSLAQWVGFELDRINGDHHIFVKDGIREILNLQPTRSGQAKFYQVHQVLDLIDQYDLVPTDEAEEDEEVSKDDDDDEKGTAQ